MINKQISHYKIVEKLGEGGMGVVYKAHDTKLDRMVALKFLPTHLTQSETDKARLLQEARAAAALNHPNVCVIYEIEDSGDHPFIAMEHIDGVTLRDRLQKGSLELKIVIDYAIQTAEALKAAHAKGIVHRDIKSENIMVTETGQVKVMDFGLAKLHGAVKLTKSTSTVGTVAYMSPEHLQGKDVDARADIFSFGVVLYEMLTGNLPFQGEYDSAMMYSIVNEEPEPVQQYRSDLSSEMLHVLNRALEKDPDERYQSANDMLIDLRRLKRDTDKVSRKSLQQMPIFDKAEPSKKLKKSYWIGLSAAAVFIMIGLWFFGQMLFQKGAETTTVQKNSIAVMYFENRSGEPNLEKILVDMLTTNLARYEELDVVSSQRLYDILKIIGKQNVEVINKDVATKVAKYAKVETMMLGSIIKIGDRIRIPVQLCDVQSGNVTGSEQVEGEKVEDLFDMADRLTLKVGNMVGTSTDDKKPLKIANVTTSSLEAYDHYLKGREAYEKMYYDEAKQYLEKAVALDPTFALAYTFLAFTNGAVGNFKERNQSLEKARLYSEKTTERERLMIEAAYEAYVEKDSEKAANKLKKVAEKYPDYKVVHYYLGWGHFQNKRYNKAIEEFKKALALDPGYGYAMNELAYTYFETGDFDKAIEYLQRYAAVSHGEANPFDSMGDMYYMLGKIDQAIDRYKKALDVKPDFGSGMKIAYMHALKENYTECIKWMDRHIMMAKSPGDQSEGYLWKGYYLYWLGDLEEALHNLQKADLLVRNMEFVSRVAMTNLVKGWIYHEKGKLARSRKSFKQYHDLWVKNYPKMGQSYNVSVYNFCQGMNDLTEGKIDASKSKLSKLESLLPEQSKEFMPRTKYCYDIFQGELLYTEGYIEKAIEVVKEASPEGRSPLPQHTHDLIRYNLPFIKDVLARAYVQKGEIDRAIAEYEKRITFDPKGENRRLIHPKLHYRLAKLYEEKGWTGKAADEYKKFLSIWKHADEDLPELIDAKERLAGLKRTE